jgi:hypothetical protein
MNVYLFICNHHLLDEPPRELIEQLAGHHRAPKPLTALTNHETQEAKRKSSLLLPLSVVVLR